MKKINFIISLVILSSVLGLSGCANTLNGMHQDWRQGSQGVANSTGN